MIRFPSEYVLFMKKCKFKEKVKTNHFFNSELMFQLIISTSQKDHIQ